jgi:hypothetical protein
MAAKCNIFAFFFEKIWTHQKKAVPLRTFSSLGKIADEYIEY